MPGLDPEADIAHVHHRGVQDELGEVSGGGLEGARVTGGGEGAVQDCLPVGQLVWEICSQHPSYRDRESYWLFIISMS